jgi:hypothetical protein
MKAEYAFKHLGNRKKKEEYLESHRKLGTERDDWCNTDR